MKKMKQKQSEFRVPLIADRVFRQLMKDVQLAQNARQRGHAVKMAREFEKEAWQYMIQYLIDDEPPPIQIEV